MELVSETKNCSAKLKRDKNATEKAKKEDKKTQEDWNRRNSDAHLDQ